MTEYFRDVADPRRLLAKERDPITGRRVPGHDAKRDDPSSRQRRPRRRVRPSRRLLVGGGVAGALIVAGAGTAALVTGGDDAAETPATTSIPTEPAAGATSLAPAASDASGAPSIATTEPVSTLSTPASLATTIPASLSIVPMVASAVATSAEVIPNDPGATASWAGPLPSFQLPIACGAAGCSLSLRDVAPGAITADGVSTVESVDGRLDVAASRVATCTGSDGASYSRQIREIMSLVLSGAQTIDGVTVPTNVAGTLSTVTPDAGYVPRVGEVVAAGTPTGCPGNTTTFVVDGPVAPV